MLGSAPSVVDLNGFAALRRDAASEDPAAVEEVGVQFEALIIGLMLKSAREASMGDGIFDSSQTRQYLELMDQQVALELARKGGFGLKPLIAGELGGAARAAEPGADGAARTPEPGVGGAARTAEPAAVNPARAFEPRTAGLAESARGGAVPAAEKFTTPADFVGKLLPAATAAAESLGVDPRVLIAQAALETGWGQSIAARPGGVSSNNLFGIKAGGSWRGETVAKWTVEYVQGVPERKVEKFRTYTDPAESFADYARLIGGSARYSEALAHNGDAEAYARAVADAGYATDPDYAEKWLSVYRGTELNGICDALQIP